jgi:anti-sigma B factor antagonist
MPEGLEISTTPAESGAVVVAVAGEVDYATGPQLAERLLDLTEHDVVVDLSAVTFLDSSGIAALVRANEAISRTGHRLRTFGEQDNVLRVLEIAGLASLFHD